MIRMYINTSDTLSQVNVELDPEEMKVNGSFMRVCVCGRGEGGVYNVMCLYLRVRGIYYWYNKSHTSE